MSSYRFENLKGYVTMKKLKSARILLAAIADTMKAIYYFALLIWREL